jgi:serine/threonine protein kinase
MSTDRPQDRGAPKAFRDEDKTLPSPVIRGATGLALAPGRVLDGRYTLVERIGAGGWGEVWRSVQNSTRREVALKILRRDVAEGQDAEARFQLEAEAVSRLVHQNTVTLFDYGRTPDGETYMAMELLDGDSLDQVLRKTGPMEAARALRVVRQVALSLDEAHGKGIVHRDVKPHNIMLLQRPGEPDFIKVLDFGVAKWVLEDHQLTTTGTTFGTPEYMSPEQVQSKPMDHRTDLYSLGVILYTLLAARPPFRGESAITVALQHINTRMPALPASCEVPRDVERLIRTLTAKDPTRRPFSAAEVAETCDGILKAMEQGPARPPRAIGAWLAVVIGVLAGTLVFALWRPWEGGAEQRLPTVARDIPTAPDVTGALSFTPSGGDDADASSGGGLDVALEIPSAPDVTDALSGRTSSDSVGSDAPPTVDASGRTSSDSVGSDAPPTVDASGRTSSDSVGSDAPPTATITITSAARGAVATLSDGTRCPCPCRLVRPVGDRVKVTVRAPDHEDHRLTLRFRGGDKDVPARLVPVPLSARDGLKGDDAPSATDGLK